MRIATRDRAQLTRSRVDPERQAIRRDGNADRQRVRRHCMSSDAAPEDDPLLPIDELFP